MTSTTGTTGTAAGRQARGARSERSGRSGFLYGATEARPGILTTEFWLTLFSAVAFVIAAYVSDTFSTDVGWALAAGVIAAYSLSRGLAKAGSREGPFLARFGDDRNP